MKKDLNVFIGKYGHYQRPVIYLVDEKNGTTEYYEQGDCNPFELVARLQDYTKRGYTIKFERPQRS